MVVVVAEVGATFMLVAVAVPVEAHQIIVLRLVARKWDVSSVVGGV